MARLPQVGGDAGNWGQVLNDYLTTTLNGDGTIKDGIVATAKLDTATQTNLTKATTALQAGSNLSDVANKPAAISNLGAATAVATTTVKTGTYTTTANQLVPVDATSGAFTVTLPTAPVDKTRVTIKKIDTSSNAVTVATAGSDVFNKAGGSTSVSLALLNQSVTVQYATTGALWYVVSDDIPLTQLDARFGSVLNTHLIAWTYTEAYRLASATRDANEALTTASVVWPDGSTGTFTTDTASSAFPGAIDAYHVTYVNGSITRTVTQPAVTRDAQGGITSQPAITVA